MKTWLAVVISCIFAAPAAAQNTVTNRTAPEFVVTNKTVDQRLTSLEKRLDALEKKCGATAKSAPCTVCSPCTCAPGVCPACPSAKSSDKLLNCPCAAGCDCTGEGRRYYVCPASKGVACELAPAKLDNVLVIRGVSHVRGADGIYRPTESKVSRDAKECGCDVCPCAVNSPTVPCPAACGSSVPSFAAPVQTYSFGGGCSGGTCAGGSCGTASYGGFYSGGSCSGGSCSGGSCGAPTRGRIFRR